MVKEPHPTANLDSVTLLHLQPMDYQCKSFIAGERYLDMVSDWQYYNTQDNDVHEIFKFVGEAFLTNAFVVERSDGSFKGYNCDVALEGTTLKIKPHSKLISRVHFNVTRDVQVTIDFGAGAVKEHTRKGEMKWVSSSR
jgi:hypothetical protein